MKYILGAATLAIAIPVVAQDSPQSLLPPGFGEPAKEEPKQPQSQPQQPAQAAAPAPAAPAAAPSAPEDLTAALANATSTGEGQASEEDQLTLQRKYDLPDSARRSLGRIGPLTPETRGLAPDAFGGESGRYLAALMKASQAPFVSRWGSILLRRALLSATDTPADINGADWAAERAWLLLRMGEADAARLIVQGVDNDNFTPRLYAVAMQTYLATADPEGLCPLSAGALGVSKEPGWQMAKAMCAAFAGDQGTASAVLNQAERQHIARGVDYRLAAKVVGAGANSRRSVTVEWTGVDRLTAWRFGLATATNVAIPDDLYATAGRHVRAWQARAPLLPLPGRLPGVEMAARLGVFSSDALVDFYSQLVADPDATSPMQDRVDALRQAFTGQSVDERVSAMRTLWTVGNSSRPDYLGEIATARAAALCPVDPAIGADVAPLIASMLTAGYDRDAARWARAVGAIDGQGGQDGWALLALGAPDPAVQAGYNRVDSYRDADGSEGKIKARMLVAGLIGLGRLSGDDAARMAQRAGVSLHPGSQWMRAIDAAAQRSEPGTVVLLAAVGLQGTDWGHVPPEHLYHIVSALHRTGLDPEARMIAAEAIARL